ncbi:hypothetical protein EVAR_18410_1 [Eumeta japonica]|uniref:Uncharacterized protein n=1 Tax=Eumeta variegata TaxID=151549 RepID=A0A4C1UUM0_EUMVA|nr:hypothetical protein EVAR_18410_1 [Eumeta japonica]
MLTDEFKEGRPKSDIVPQNIDAVRELMMQDRHVTYREIKTSLGISMTSIHKHQKIFCYRGPTPITEIYEDIAIYVECENDIKIIVGVIRRIKDHLIKGGNETEMVAGLILNWGLDQDESRTGIEIKAGAASSVDIKDVEIHGMFTWMEPSVKGLENKNYPNRFFFRVL